MCINPRHCTCENNEIDNLETLPLKCGPCSKCRKKTNEMMSQLLKDQPEQEITECQQSTPEVSTDLIRMIITRSRGNNPAPLSGEINVTELQQNDIKIVYQWVKQNQRVSHAEVSKLSPAIRHYWHLWNSLCIVDNVLCKKFYPRCDKDEHLQIIVPQSLRGTILEHMHDSLMSGHRESTKPTVS